MDSVEDLALPNSRLVVRRYVPHALRHDAVLVWFHGGGWVAGDLAYSDAFCRTLADGLGLQVHSVEYRLAPEHPFPAAVHDALAAVRAAASTARVALGGDSAGGNLAAVCAQQLRDDPTVDVLAQLLVYPVLDTDVTRESYLRNDGIVLGRREMTWFFDRYVPDSADRESTLVAPLRASDLRGLAPTVLAVAGHDPLHDEGIAYTGALRAAGVAVSLLDFPPLVHGFLRLTAVAPAAAAALEQIVTALQIMLADVAPSIQDPSAIDFSSR